MNKVRSLVTTSSHFWILLAFCGFALMPLTAPGYFSAAHDARHSVYFLQMFDLSVRDGAWYPRWAADMVFGYGYPLWLILAPLPFFLGEAFHLVGFDLVSAVKLTDGVAFFFSALAMYLFASRVLGKNAGLVAGIAYAYVPYHLVDLYVRAAQAELVSFVFPPLVLWAFYELATTHRVRYIAFAALAYAGLIFAHISMTALFTPIIGLYLLFLLITTRRRTEDGRPSVPRPAKRSSVLFAFYTSVAIALALGIAAIFLLPILLEQKYLTSDPLIGGFFNYRKHFLNASQLFSPFWGYGYAGENGADQFSLQLGLIPVLLSFVALWAITKTRDAIRDHCIFFAMVLAGIVFLVLPMSAPLWDPFSAIIAFAQFPWRLLIVGTAALAFLSGAALHAFPDDIRDLSTTLVVILVFVAANYAYTEPQHTDAVFNYQAQMEFEVKERELLGDTIWITGDRPQDSPLVEQYINGGKLTKAIALDDGTQVETLRYGGQSVDARVTSNTPARVMFYTRYFPGWTATVNSQPTNIEPYGEQGLILVRVPAGSSIVHIQFQDTLPRSIGAIISGISLLIAFGLFAFQKQVENRLRFLYF
jgi:hypothetical protein